MSTVSDALTALAAKLEKDELTVVLPFGDGYLTNIISNSDPANVIAQSLALEVNLGAALPNMEQAAIKDTATALKALLDLEAATVLTPVAPVAPVAA